uniref:Chorismate synthase n=1 Tax=uncultured bacterium contig00024 TaxID=1181513 RepID=A0A806JYN5_9BACT|nr:chorismate synthase [uncultured bacterium contig00024]
MSGNTFGSLFRVTTFGESHGEAMGCIIDGCLSGLEISVSDIEKELIRRRPGSVYGSRDEKDTPVILSGVFEGKTLGSPIAIVVRNDNQKSADYDELKDVYRPSHADFTWEAKFGFRDHRGGGRSSGRETLCRVAAGSVAKKLLAANGINIRAWTSKIAGVKQPCPGEEGFDFEEIERNPLRVPGKKEAEKASAILEEIRREGDSAGGVISCLVTGVPAGLGEPVFDKLDARLAAAVLSIGACKGIEFGAGFSAADVKGSENNSSDKSSGGILGGISNGQDIFFNAAFKPTPSISKPQKAKDKDGNIREIIIKGRHDVCIVPRAVPVVEAMTAITLADFLLLARSNKL